MSGGNHNLQAARQVASTGILRVLDTLRYGGFLLDLCGRVISFNIIALSCLGDGLALAGEYLRATDRAMDHRLQRMIGTSAPDGNNASLPASVAIQRRSRLPLVLRVMRLEEEAPRAADTARILLIVLDPELPQDPPREILTQAFALTRAEAEVAAGILSGKSLAEIATMRRVKVGTVRAYSKAVYSKTQTRGQADLTGVLTRISFVVPQAPATVPQLQRPANSVQPPRSKLYANEFAGADKRDRDRG
jgi:DNA-binding CsgD family transcriptional regulator